MQRRGCRLIEDRSADGAARDLRLRYTQADRANRNAELE